MFQKACMSMVEKGWGQSGAKGVGGRVIYGYRGSVLQDEKGSGDWLHNNRNEFNTTELHT